MSDVRQRFNESSPALWMGAEDEAGDEETNHDDEVKPLTATPVRTGISAVLPRSVRRSNKKRSHFMISQQRDAAEDDSITCWGDLWRLVASGLLSLVLVSPFLYSFYQYSTAPSSLPIPTYPADLLQCAQDYNMSYALLHRQVQLSSDVCESAIVFGDDSKGNTPDTDVHCTCTNPLMPLRHVPSAPQYFSKWDQVHQTNVKRATSCIPGDKPDVLLYGDSITEHWVGTDMGEADQESMSVKRQFDAIFDEGRQAQAFGLAGDRCPQLLYRLQHGELVNCPDFKPPVIWVLIGTNDQSDHCSPESILIGILNIATYLQEQRPNARIVLNSILPKPNPTSREWTSQTNKYYDPVTWINQRLACYAQGAAPNVEYFDASWLFVTPDDGLVPEELMPDGLHPSGKGARIWGEAILKRVEEIVEEQQKAAEQVPES